MRLHIKWPTPFRLSRLIHPSTTASCACRQNKIPSHNPFTSSRWTKATVLAYQPISARPQGAESRFCGLFWIYKLESNSWSGDVAGPGAAPAARRCRYVHARSRGDRPTPSPLSLKYVHFCDFLKQSVCPVLVPLLYHGSGVLVKLVWKLWGNRLLGLWSSETVIELSLFMFYYNDLFSRILVVFSC